jgi:hypothetical protein
MGYDDISNSFFHQAREAYFEWQEPYENTRKARGMFRQNEPHGSY